MGLLESTCQGADPGEANAASDGFWAASQMKGRCVSHPSLLTQGFENLETSARGLGLIPGLVLTKRGTNI